MIMFERIQKILSANGVASRREAERLIREGRVTVGGVPAIIGQRARFCVDEISVDNVPLAAVKPLVYIALNKPCGYVSTVRDDMGRKTIIDLVSDAGIHVYPVGRLDMDSEGLLLLTNDGKFANAVAHPSFNITKTYEVKVRGDADGAASLLRDPMEIDSHLVQAVSVHLQKRFDGGGILEVVIREGRNRQIRKMCALCGLRVLALKRTAIGDLTLGSLSSGKWRYLTDEEVRELGGFNDG